MFRATPLSWRHGHSVSQSSRVVSYWRYDVTTNIECEIRVLKMRPSSQLHVPSVTHALSKGDLLAAVFSLLLVPKDKAPAVILPWFTARLVPYLWSLFEYFPHPPLPTSTTAPKKDFPQSWLWAHHSHSTAQSSFISHRFTISYVLWELQIDLRMSKCRCTHHNGENDNMWEPITSDLTSLPTRKQAIIIWQRMSFFGSDTCRHRVALF